MRKRRWMISLAAGAALLFVGTASAPIRGAPERADAPTKAKLTTVKLSAPETVLARPDAQQLRLWNGIVLPPTPQQMLQLEAGKPGPALTLAGAKVVFTLTGDNIEVLVNGQTRKLERITTTDSPGMIFKPVRLPLDGGREYVLAFPYGYVYRAQVLSQGVQNEANRGVLVFRSGAVQQFELGGQKVSLFDSNTDGFYVIGEDTIAFGSVDGATVFAPLHKLLGTPAGVYQIRSLAKNGSEIEYAPYVGQTGQITIAKGSEELLIRAAFASPRADLSFLAAPEAAKPSTVTVVPGSYDLLYGLAYSPSLEKVVATLVPGTLKAIDAKAGQQTTLALGAPYSLDFTYTTSGGKLAISSSSFNLRGKAGEQYTNTSWASEPQIELVVNGKSTALGKMEFG